MAEFIHEYHLGGLLIGLATFVIIGLFHPLVIKGEYYFGPRIKWAFAGVHLEMDFHNEAEVEEAMKIVEEYRDRPAIARESYDTIVITSSVDFDADAEVDRIIDKVENDTSRNELAVKELTLDTESPFTKAFNKRIMVLDGAMGTMIQSYRLAEADFRGERFASHPTSLKGNNDLLSITRPDVVKEIHCKYLEAGADIISTNTFNAQAISMADFHTENLVKEINIAAAAIARAAADEFTAKTPERPRFVAGSMGPTSKTCSLAAGSIQPGWETFSYERLTAAYTEQASALIEGGVDALLIETIFDHKNAEAAIIGAVSAMKATGNVLPIMLSFNISNPDGNNMLGQSVFDFMDSLPEAPIFSIGLNCIPDIEAITPLVVQLGQKYHYKITLHPNAGFPDAHGHYTVTPEEFRSSLWPLLEGHLLNLAGGCCGTTDTHIRKVAEAVEPFHGLTLSPHTPGEVSSVSISPRRKNIHHTATETHECECCHPQQPKPAEATLSTSGVFDAIVVGNAAEAAQATRVALDNGEEPQEIINRYMITAMSEVGRQFQEGKAFVPQLLMAGRAMKAALELIKPLLAGGSVSTLGKVVIGTVKGDLHDIGKNLVASMLEGCGFDVVNIGIDVPADVFVEAVRTHHPDVLCMSALLTTTMTYMKDVIDALDQAGLRDKVKIMVGGAPVSQNFADEIGADGYSDNANTAVELARRLVGA